MSKVTPLRVITIALPLVAFFLFSYSNPSYRIMPKDDVPGLINLLHGKGVQDGEKDVSRQIKTYRKQQNDAPDTKREQEMVNYYYNMVTDFYEYGWGQSFHFAHTKTDETHEASILRHEMRVAEETRVTKGMSVLDAGCGVGGPARAIAKATGANVTGVTLNDYQVGRATKHNQSQDMQDQVTIEQGDFTKLKYKENTFGAAYAIESTCHAPKLVDAYQEIFRVLKPGGRFAAMEWIKAIGYQDNDEHNKILHDIEFGNGLPPVRSRDDVLQAAKDSGFKLITDIDLAQDNVETRPWYHRLDMSKISYYMTHISCYVMEFLRIAPAGTVSVHGMLMRGAWGLVDGGKKNVFTPMHLFVFEKPVE